MLWIQCFLSVSLRTCHIRDTHKHIYYCVLFCSAFNLFTSQKLHRHTFIILFSVLLKVLIHICVYVMQQLLFFLAQHLSVLCLTKLESYILSYKRLFIVLFSLLSGIHLHLVYTLSESPMTTLPPQIQADLSSLYQGCR